MLDIVGLVQDFGGAHPVLKEVDLSIAPGEFMAIVGENGAGKTTLVKHFNGLLRPSKGDVLLDGKSIKGLPVSRVARHVGYVFQNPDHQIFHDTVVGEISFGPRHLGLNDEEINSTVQRAMDAVGLTAYAKHYPMALSRGTRQRIAVASVVAMGCRIIILDEPTTGQDYREAQQIMALAKELCSQGTTVIFITHDMELVAEHARRVIVMGEGQVLLDGTPRDVFSETAILESARLIPPQVVELGFLWDGQAYLEVDALVNAIEQRRDMERVQAVG